MHRHALTRLVAAVLVTGTTATVTADPVHAAPLTDAARPVFAHAAHPTHRHPVRAQKVRESRPVLPLGAASLPETRRATVLARGVNRTLIVRGVTPARASAIATTSYGPWRVNVVRIDPRTARVRLQTTFGGNLAVTEPTSTLARWAKALVGMNASYFAFTRSRFYPGDPTGLIVHAGTVLSEPTGTAAEENVLIDAARMRLRMGHYSWAWRAVNRRTGRALTLDGVNTALPTPPGCVPPSPETSTPSAFRPAGPTPPTDPKACTAPGRTVRLTPQFARTTPPGSGVELVVDRRGCVARTATHRGTHIGATEYSIQATGADAATLARFARRGDCLRTTETVRDTTGRALHITRTTYGVTGRHRLVADGKIVAPPVRGSLAARNPRSVIGRTADGCVLLLTIDGRTTTSVGTTLAETARVAAALGMTDAVNLDGGGSTTLAVQGRVVNGTVTDTDDGTTRPVARERAVSDAIVLVPR